VALAQTGRNLGAGVAFMVAGGIVYEIIAANCSSPQTTELNAGARAPTLMKYVHLGLGQSAVFVAAAIYFEPNHAAPILAGGSLAAVMMYGLYKHARDTGVASSAPPTEQHSNGGSRGLSWNNPT